MKKLFSLPVITTLSFVANAGYAATQSQLVAVYSCTNGCNVTNNANKFSCAYPDGKNCGNPTTNIFVPQMSNPVANVMPAVQEKSTATSARAARVSRPNATTKPIGNKPNGGNMDKSSNEECPAGCKRECLPVANESGPVFCDCFDADGGFCKTNQSSSGVSQNQK